MNRGVTQPKHPTPDWVLDHNLVDCRNIERDLKTENQV
jgi:hypothetical protein